MCFCVACEPPLHLFPGQECPHHGAEHIDYNCPVPSPEYGGDELPGEAPINPRRGPGQLQTSYEQIGCFWEAASSNGLGEEVQATPCHDDAAADQLVHEARATAGLVVQYKGRATGSSQYWLSRCAGEALQAVGGKHAPYVLYTYTKEDAVPRDEGWLQLQCDAGMKVWVAPVWWVLQYLNSKKAEEGAYVSVSTLDEAAADAAEKAESEDVRGLVERFRRCGVNQLSCSSSESVGKELAQLFKGLLALVPEDVPETAEDEGITTIVKQMCTSGGETQTKKALAIATTCEHLKERGLITSWYFRTTPYAKYSALLHLNKDMQDGGGPVKAYIGMLVVRSSGSYAAQQSTEVAPGKRVLRDWGHPCYGYSVAIFPLPEGIEHGFFMWPTSAALEQQGGMDIKSPGFSHKFRAQIPSDRGAALGELYLSWAEHGKEAVRAAFQRRCDRSIRERHTQNPPLWEVVRQDLGIPEDAYMDRKPWGASAGRERVHPVLDETIAPDQLHQVYEDAVNKYEHLEGTKVRVDPRKPNKRYKVARDMVDSVYSPSYTVEFKHPRYGATSCIVTYRADKGHWRTYLPGKGKKVTAGGVGCKGGPAGPVIVHNMVKHLADSLWQQDQPPPPPPPPPAAAAAATTASLPQVASDGDLVLTEGDTAALRRSKRRKAAV